MAIPRKEYKYFLQWQKAVKPPWVFKTFKPTAAALKDLKQACEDYKKGKYMTINDLKRRLGIKAQS